MPVEAPVRRSRGGRRVARRPRRRRSPLPWLVALVAVLAVVKLIDPFAPKAGADPGSAAGISVPDTPEWVTQELLPLNEYSRPGTPAEQNHSFFQNLAETGETYASSHFLVGLDGEIIQNVPLNEIAYCSSNRNADTIAIECCHPDDSGQFNQATYDSLVRLTRWLMDAYDLEPDQIIRHYDVTGKICPKYFVDHPESWEEFLAQLETGEE